VASIYLGISGGHTRSVACAVDSENNALACVTGESLNQHTFGDRAVMMRLGKLLDRLAKQIGLPRTALAGDTVKAVISIAGAASEEDQALIEICLLRNGWNSGTQNYQVVDDTWAGLLGGALSYAGTCAFSGTGASVYVGDPEAFKGKPNKIDGWGPIIGDFGSGFQLAVEMFRLFGRYYDEKKKPPPLFAEVVKLDPLISSITNVQRWFDNIYNFYPNEWRIKMAALAAAATAAADRPDPDPDAIQLVNAAANEMIKSIRIALEWKAARSLPVVLQGGMFEHSRLYRQQVIGAITGLTTGHVGLAKYKPALGALFMARFPERSPLDPAVVESIEASFRMLSLEAQESLMYNLPEGD
jgi:N-acetylglucosamine kinase-like BadF-type ATPase